MKLFVIAGERSGDLHASKVIASLKEHDQNIEIKGWGGDEMQSAGAKIQMHIKELLSLIHI